VSIYHVQQKTKFSQPFIVVSIYHVQQKTKFSQPFIVVSIYHVQQKTKFSQPFIVVSIYHVQQKIKVQSAIYRGVNIPCSDPYTQEISKPNATSTKETIFEFLGGPRVT
jgi:hypothetical protein